MAVHGQVEPDGMRCSVSPLAAQEEAARHGLEAPTARVRAHLPCTRQTSPQRGLNGHGAASDSAVRARAEPVTSASCVGCGARRTRVGTKPNAAAVVSSSALDGTTLRPAKEASMPDRLTSARGASWSSAAASDTCGADATPRESGVDGVGASPSVRIADWRTSAWHTAEQTHGGRAAWHGTEEVRA
jgi:hypothetical protein